MIGLNEQQSHLFGSRLAKLLGGSQVSNISGDNLGVDKSALSRLEHFGQFLFSLIFLSCVLDRRHRCGLRIATRVRLLCRMKDLVSPWKLGPSHGTEGKVGLYCSRLAS